MEKKIAILTSFMSGQGGVERVIQRMRGFISFNVLSVFDGAYDKKNFFHKEVVKCNNWAGEENATYIRRMYENKLINALYHFWVVLNYVKINNIDIAITTSPIQTIYLRLIRVLLRRKYDVIAWPHFSMSSGFGDFNRFVKADAILCISIGIMEQFKKIGVDNSKLKYFPNPFSKNVAKSEKKYTQSKATFFYIGRIQFHGQKKLKELVDGFSLVDMDYELVIIGDGDDYQLLFEYVQDKGLNEKIKIIKKWQENPWVIAKNYDCLVLTSRFEGLPTVIGEALSHGIPCISSDCETGPRDFIINGENGYLYEPGDTVSLKNKIEIFINCRNNFSKDYIRSTMERFYIDSYLERLDLLLKRDK